MTLLEFQSTHYHLLIASSTAVSGGEGGGTLLHVPRLLVSLAHRAHGDGVGTQDVAVTVAVVTTATAVAARPHKQGSQSPSPLEGKNKTESIKVTMFSMTTGSRDGAYS